MHVLHHTSVAKVPYPRLIQHLLSVQRERNMRLRGRLDLLLGENEALHMKVADLKVLIINPVQCGITQAGL